jgi:ubiquinone/menaquinone biosynthesis C-methylase UbiE
MSDRKPLWWRLVNFGFRLLYNEMAFTYDLVSWVVSLGDWHKWQQSVLQFLPENHHTPILELAHGTGTLNIDIQRAGYRLWSYDLSPYMGRIAQHKIRQAGFIPILINGKAQQLPIASQSVSVVVSTFPTNFIFMPSTLSEVHRVLQNDGVLIVVMHGALTGSGIVKQFIDWLYKITGQGSIGDDRDLLRWFEEAHFEVNLHTVAYTRSYAQVLIARKSP